MCWLHTNKRTDITAGLLKVLYRCHRMSRCCSEARVNCVIWFSCSLIFFFSPGVCASTQTAASWTSEHAGIKILCDRIPIHLVLDSESPTVQHNVQNMVLLCQTSSYSNLPHSVRTAEVGTYSSLTGPERLCIYHMDSFTVIALSLQTRWQRTKFTGLDG